MAEAGTVTLAGSGVAIGRLGLGVARLYGGAEARASARLVEAALACGIRHFDTAPSYGHGSSEDVLGAALVGVEGVTIATKVGIDRPAGTAPARAVAYRRFVRPLLARAPGLKTALLNARRTASGPASDAAAPAPRRLGKDEVIRALEESLRRLRRPRVDLYLVHEPDQFVIDDELAAVFESLQRQGLVGAFGLAYGRAAADAPAFGEVLQSQYQPPPAGEMPAKVTRIFHGVMRAAPAGADPAGRLRTALDEQRDAAFVFSASTRAQIRQVAG